jgi:prepilin-type N-terminal cleavage/methylation domain-containing protein
MSINMKKIFKKSHNGFTLVELLVSIAIFAIISIVMSNIIISISKFSLENERRSDFLSQLDNAANAIQNDLRGAKSAGRCPDGRIFRYDGNKYYMLNITDDKVLWTEVFDGILCRIAPSGRSIYLTSNSLKINSVLYDSQDVGDGDPNTILYVLVEACDPDIHEGSAAIFDCSLNPYKYIFAITTRIINPTPTP